MKVFKKGQLVTRKDGNNASDFNKGQLDIMGASASKYNEQTVFEVEGTVKLITFDHDKEIYGAYLLKKDGVNVGYVYNTALKKFKMKEKIVLEVTMEIRYQDEDGRKEAIENAKECVMSTSVFSTNGATPLKSKLK
jgi:hypothetical protein